MTHHPPTFRHIAISLCAGLALALLAACGGGGDGGDSSAAGPTPRAVPTMPRAQFAAPTTMISGGAGVTETDGVTETEGVTETGSVTESAEAATPEPAAAGAVDLERGASIYANRKCGDCHGAQGEGVEGKGSPIAGTALSAQEFDDLMRTGGEIGRDHIYGPNAISPGGMTALHAWLQSLGE